MACMEHNCPGCGHTIFNNRPSAACPKCGELMHGTFDEDLRDHVDGGRDEEQGDDRN